MGGGRQFLMLKGFHPENFQNQKRVWEAEQAQKDERKRQAETQATWEKEQQQAANERLLHGQDGRPGGRRVDFMYGAPPGLKEQQEKDELERARKEQLQAMCVCVLHLAASTDCRCSV
jgi:hypothetical protein